MNLRLSPAVRTDSATPTLAPVPSAEVRVGDLIGGVVLDRDGRAAGWVADLLIAPDGRVSSYLCGFGGYMGIGCKLVAVDATRAEAVVGGADGVSRLLTDMAAAEFERLCRDAEAADAPPPAERRRARCG